MRVSIKGVPAIPKEVWSTKAGMHREFSESLSLLLSTDESGPLAKALREMIEKNKRLAEACDELYKETRKGRPTKKPARTENGLLAILHPHLYELRKRPGRPTQYGAKYDKLTFKVVAEQRKELAQANKSKPTVKAAIDSLNAQLARDSSRRELTAIKTEFERVHSAYKRGKKLLDEKSKS